MKEKIRAMENKLRQYYENAAAKEGLKFKLEILNRHKEETENDLANAYDNTLRKALQKTLEEANAQILSLNCKSRLLEKEFADLDYLISGLTEREKKILVHKYKNKKTMKSLSISFYISESRLCQIKNQMMVYLYDRLNA